MRNKKTLDYQILSKVQLFLPFPGPVHYVPSTNCFHLSSEWEGTICYCQNAQKSIENIKPLADRKKEIAAGGWKTP